ncbi:hypothetical protein ACHQM5_018467 [Ranunculus cassubicifolius]
MSKLFFSRVANFFFSSSRRKSLAGVDKAGNKYFTRKEQLDDHGGIFKEKRWVTFKGEEDPTSVPVEWICWLNGQRKQAPTPQELAELEARRERVKLNVALLKKEDEERKLREGSNPKRKTSSTGKAQGPDLKSFIQQYPSSSSPNSTRGYGNEEASGDHDNSKQQQAESLEPTGSGASFKPGTWQPPT